MNEQQERELTAGLQALADSTRQASCSAAVEEAIMRAFPPRADAPRPAAARLLPLAAALVFAVAGALWIARSAKQPGFDQDVGPLTDFIAMPLASALPTMESASVIRVTLPVAALPSYGIAIVPEMTQELVQADLLVAQDGHPRAIRLVGDSSRTGSTP
jgi:hypothetical protein